MISPIIAHKRGDMPLIHVNVFEDEITTEQTKDLIERITEAIATVISPKMRDVTWVVVHEVKSGSWGVGGIPLGLADVRRAMNG
jgi:4-oxalocrotonate tautomerase